MAARPRRRRKGVGRVKREWHGSDGRGSSTRRRSRPARGSTTTLSLLVILGLWALTGLGCAKKIREIKIGEYGSLTGDKATFGLSTEHGIEMAMKEADAAGGVSGVPIRMIVEDDQGKPEEAATAVNKLLVQDQVGAILGEVASSNSLAGAPICQQNKVPMITPASTNPSVTQVGDYIFRICFIDPFQGTVMARFASQTLHLTKVAILHDAKSDYSVGLSKFFENEFQRLGGQVVSNESYVQGDVDFKAPLTALISRAPEAIFVPGYYTEVGLVARQARELGYSGPLLGGDGWDSPKLTEIGGPAIEGCYFSNHYSTDDPNPVVQDFIKQYKSSYDSAPDAMAALGYDAARLLAQKLGALHDSSPDLFNALIASSGSGGDTRARAEAALRDLIAQTSGFPGVTGVISLDADRNAKKPAVVLQIRNGAYHFVQRISD